MAGYSDWTFLLCCTVLCFAVVRRLFFFVRCSVHSTEVNNRVSMVWLFFRCFPLLPVLLIAAMDLDFRHRYKQLCTQYLICLFSSASYNYSTVLIVYVCAVFVRVCLLCSHQSFAVLTAVTLGYAVGSFVIT